MTKYEKQGKYLPYCTKHCAMISLSLAQKCIQLGTVRMTLSNRKSHKMELALAIN